MIKAIIFDWGGVLTTEGKFSRRFIDGFPRKLEKPDKEVMRIIEDNWELARIEKITADEFYEKCASEIGCAKTEFKIVSINRMSQINKEMIKLVKKLKKKYRIGLLSNHISKILRNIIKANKLNNLFDVIVISSEHKMFKPNAEIYLKAASLLNVKPEECIFIDDQENIMIGAKEVGMKTILFKNKEDLEKKLKEIL